MIRPFRAWNVFPEFGIGASAKCGSTSLTTFFANPPPTRVAFEKLPKDVLTIGIVRNPVKRFWSLYANIQERTRRRSENNFYKQLEGKSAKEVLQVFEHNWLHDIHYHPQTLIGLEKCDYVIRLEDCFWLPTENASKRNWDDGSLGVYNRKRSLYRDDWNLWEAAEGRHQELIREHKEMFSCG